jgi:hypothetical protein
LFHATFPRRKPERLSLTGVAGGRGGIHTARDQSAAEIMIALASPRTRSEFSSPERESEVNREDRQSEGNETDDEGIKSPTRRARKRVELAKDVEGLGIHA